MLKIALLRRVLYVFYNHLCPQQESLKSPFDEPLVDHAKTAMLSYQEISVHKNPNSLLKS